MLPFSFSYINRHDESSHEHTALWAVSPLLIQPLVVQPNTRLTGGRSGGAWCHAARAITEQAAAHRATIAHALYC